MKCCFDVRACVQRSQHLNRGNGGAGEFGRDIIRDADKAKDMDLERPTCRADVLQILAREGPKAEIQSFASNRLFGRIGMPFKLIADRGSDEVGTICVKRFRNQQIDVAEVDISQVDRDLLGVLWLSIHLVKHSGHFNSPCSIPLDGIWMVHRKFKREMIMSRAIEKRMLQLTVAMACIVPVSGGAWGVLQGAGMLGHGGDVTLDSHVRYLSGLLLGIGLAFLSLIPNIEKRGQSAAILSAIVVAGGLGRLYGVLADGWPAPTMAGALAMELGVVPLLYLWQRRIAVAVERS